MAYSKEFAEYCKTLTECTVYDALQQIVSDSSDGPTKQHANNLGRMLVFALREGMVNALQESSVGPKYLQQLPNDFVAAQTIQQVHHAFTTVLSWCKNNPKSDQPFGLQFVRMEMLLRCTLQAVNGIINSSQSAPSLAQTSAAPTTTAHVSVATEPASSPEPKFDSVRKTLDETQVPNQNLLSEEKKASDMVEPVPTDTKQTVSWTIRLIEDDLCDAARDGDLETVKRLHVQGADIHYRDDAAIKVAASRGHLDVVEYLVAYGANVAIQHNYPVRFAASCGHLSVVKYLHARGADISAQNNFALCQAANEGHLEVVKFLVAHGAVCDTALALAASMGHLDVVILLYTSGINDRRCIAVAKGYAKRAGHVKVVQFLDLVSE